MGLVRGLIRTSLHHLLLYILSIMYIVYLLNIVYSLFHSFLLCTVSVE